MNGKRESHIWKACNEITRKMEEIDIEVSELYEGQSVYQMFWCESAQRYVSIPGATLHTVKDGDVVLNDSQ